MSNIIKYWTPNIVGDYVNDSKRYEEDTNKNFKSCLSAHLKLSYGCFDDVENTNPMKLVIA